MSYCRFSSDNWKSDLYIYEGECGIYVGVKGIKRIGDIFPLDFNSPEALLDSYKKQMKSLDNCTIVPINLPFAGESFWFDELESSITFVKQLKELGYHIRDGVIEDMKEDS